MPPNRSCLSQAPASGCRSVGERCEAPGGHVCRFRGQTACIWAGEGQVEHSQPRYDCLVCLVRVSGLLEREMGGAQVGSQMMEGKADSQSDGRLSREAHRLAFGGGVFMCRPQWNLEIRSD